MLLNGVYPWVSGSMNVDPVGCILLLGEALGGSELVSRSSALAKGTCSWSSGVALFVLPDVLNDVG